MVDGTDKTGSSRNTSSLEKDFRKGFFEKSREVDKLTKKVDLLEEKLKFRQESESYFELFTNSIVQDPQYVQDSIPNSYVFFRPVHRVGGDFLYFEEISSRQGIIAVADCTGHGLAGRGMAQSITQKLDDLFPDNRPKNFKHLEPHEVLTKLDEFVDVRINKATRKGTRSAQNTLELQLVKYTAEFQVIEFSGSKSNLILYRKQDDALYVIKGDSDPIGYNEPGSLADEFDQHKVYLEPGDQFYLFSDGIPDLFGGPKDKKLKRKGFHKIIQETVHYGIKEEGDLVVEKLREWSHDFKGAADDISLLIVEVPDDTFIPQRNREGDHWIYSLDKKTKTYGSSTAEIKTYNLGDESKTKK